jgi:hypothetical protein
MVAAALARILMRFSRAFGSMRAGDRMNRHPIPLLLLLSMAMACAACDRRESTGTSDVARGGQGETPEAARDARETSTVPSTTTVDIDSAPPPTDDETQPSPPSDTQPDPAQDPTTERDEGDTLHRP